MNKIVRIITFSMLGLLLSSNQIVLAQTKVKNQDLLMEIDKFFKSLVTPEQSVSFDQFGNPVDKFGKPLKKADITINCGKNPSVSFDQLGNPIEKNVSMGNLIARYDNPNYKPVQFGNVSTDEFGNPFEKECKVFFNASNVKMSGQEKAVLMKINDFFMSLQKQGKVTLVSQVGTQIPSGDPVARYNNPNYVKGSTLIGNAREEILVFATPKNIK